MGGVVRPAAGDHRHPARAPPRPSARSRRRCSSVDSVAASPVVPHGTSAVRCPRRSATRRTLGMPLHRLACRKWSHQCGYRPEKHELFPSLGLARRLGCEIEAVRSATDKDAIGMMSSMRRCRFARSSCWPSAARRARAEPAQPVRRPPVAPPSRPAAADDINYALADWRRLRAERRLCLRRLCPLPERQSRLAGRKRAAPQRRKGDAARRECRRPCIAFFRTDEPRSGNGWARLAEAYAATGRHRRGAGRGARGVGVGRPVGHRRAAASARASAPA